MLVLSHSNDTKVDLHSAFWICLRRRYPKTHCFNIIFPNYYSTWLWFWIYPHFFAGWKNTFEPPNWPLTPGDAQNNLRPDKSCLRLCIAWWTIIFEPNKKYKKAPKPKYEASSLRVQILLMWTCELYWLISDHLFLEGPSVSTTATYILYPCVFFIRHICFTYMYIIYSYKFYKLPSGELT